MSEPEHRAGTEFRVAGRVLSGRVMVYGDVAPSHRERFVPGSLAPVPAVPMRLQHDPALEILPAGGFILNDTARALEVRAELPADSAALRLVKRGALSGWSVGFHAREERREAGVRVIERAALVEISLVDVGAYPGARAEVRARSGRTLRASVPYDRALACECIAQKGPGSGGACVPLAKFAKVAGDGMADAINGALADAGEVLAVYKDYARPLGSARRGTLRATSTDEGLDIEVDLPTGEAGDLAVSAAEAAGIIARPLVDYDRSEFTDGPDGRTVTKAHLRAILIGSTDAREGWPDATIDYEGEGRRAAPPRRRRLWL